MSEAVPLKPTAFKFNKGDVIHGYNILKCLKPQKFNLAEKRSKQKKSAKRLKPSIKYVFLMSNAAFECIKQFPPKTSATIFT